MDRGSLSSRKQRDYPATKEIVLELMPSLASVVSHPSSIFGPALSCRLLDCVYIGFGNISSLSGLLDARQRMVGLSVTAIVCDSSQPGISNYLADKSISAVSAL